MNNVSTTQELTKKERLLVAQRRYKARLRSGAVIEGSNNDITKYKAKNAEYMKAYRLKQKQLKTVEPTPVVIIPIIDPIIDPTIISIIDPTIIPIIDPIIDPTIISIIEPIITQITTPIIETIVKLPIPTNKPIIHTPAHILNPKSYTAEAIDIIIGKITFLVFKVLKKELTPNIKRILKALLNGNDIKGDIKYVKRELYFLSQKNILEFINKINVFYPNVSTFKSYLIVLVSVLSRLTGYNKQYQIVTQLAINANQDYINKRDDNEISEENFKNLINFSNDAINEKLNVIYNINDIMLFSIYTLLVPRRLEWSMVKVMKEDDGINNILILDYENPKNTKVIFNNYKTFNTFKKQELDNLPNNFLNILYQYIENNHIKNEDYLFTTKNKQPITKTLFSKMVSKLFSSIYNHNMSLNFIRISYATYHDNIKYSNKDIQKIAHEMGHDIITHTQYIKRFAK